MIRRHIDLAPQVILVILMIVALTLKWAVAADTASESEHPDPAGTTSAGGHQ